MNCLILLLLFGCCCNSPSTCNTNNCISSKPLHRPCGCNDTPDIPPAWREYSRAEKEVAMDCSCGCSK